MFILVIMVIASIAGLLYLSTLIDFDKTNYMRSWVDKVEILNSTSSPKIVFVGGSNLAFGLDSPLIEKKFNMPVINMGVHAGIGLRYMLNKVSESLNKGDVLVIVPEYDCFYTHDRGYGGKALVYILTNFDLAGVKDLPFERKLFFLFTAPEYVRTRIYDFLAQFGKSEKIKISVYSRQGFNRNGDNVQHLDQPQQKIKVFCEGLQKVNMEVVGMLNDYYEDVTKRGIRMVFMYPCLERDSFRNDISGISFISKYLSKNLKCEIMSTPDEFVLPKEYFYDTVYHLNRRGVEIRTQKVIDKLSRVIVKKSL